jgi:hypothetical protein
LDQNHLFGYLKNQKVSQMRHYAEKIETKQKEATKREKKK